MHQEALLKLKQLLDEKRPGTNNTELARALRVSEATVRHYLDDRWTSVDRGILERFADFAQCDVRDMFETRPSPFWDAFSGPGNQCFYLRAEDRKQAGDGTQRVHRDDRALTLIAALIKDCAPATEVYERSVTTEDEFLQLAHDNVIVVGSPKSNPASEYGLSLIFGASPFSPNTTSPPPFRFVWHPSIRTPESTFGMLLEEPKARCGIWLHAERKVVVASYNPNEAEFRASRIKDGRDCGVVVLMNHADQSLGAAKKLIVLAGFTKVGTEAAARRLVSDFREMEPRNGETCVWGIVEAVFRKEAGRPETTIIHTDWRYRSGGRLPIPFKANPIHIRGGPRARSR
jgi:hypothetical protein